jgi:hypothetical protein
MQVRCVTNRVGLVAEGEGRFRVGETRHASLSLTVGRVYAVLDARDGFYRVIDDRS